MKKNAATAIALLALVATTLASTPAQAADPISVTLSATTGLANAGDNIDVTVSGLVDTQGVFVQLCQAPILLDARPDNCFGSPLWLSNDATKIGLGAVAPTAAPLAVQADFTAGANDVNCLVFTGCIVFVRFDDSAPNDTSADSSTPITFANIPVDYIPWPVTFKSFIDGITASKHHVVLTLSGTAGQKVVIKIGARTIKTVLKGAGGTYRFAAPKGASTKVSAKVGGKIKLNKHIKLG